MFLSRFALRAYDDPDRKRVAFRVGIAVKSKIVPTIARYLTYVHEPEMLTQ